MIDKDLLNAKILIVDDMQSNIDIIKGLLEIEGYKHVECTTDSRKVIKLVKSFDPDLILLDLMMPKLSGFEVMELLKTERLKSLDPTRYSPILVLTADVNPDVKRRALSGGAKDFVSKPFDLIEVSFRIKNLLETQYLYQLLKSKKEAVEEKIITLLKINDEWYR